MRVVTCKLERWIQMAALLSLATCCSGAAMAQPDIGPLEISVVEPAQESATGGDLNRATEGGVSGVVNPTEPLAKGVDESNAPSLFLKAAEAYEEGNYQSAAVSYRILVDAGFGTADVHYNLANALLRSGELGRAIGAYRRAQILRPRDQDVRANLSFARDSTKDDVAPPAPPSWSRTLFFWHHALSFEETVKLLLVVLALFWTVVAVLALRLAWRPKALAGGLLIIALALLASVGYRWRSPQRIAVVLPSQTDVFSGTDLQSRVIFNLHAGTELEVATSGAAWTQFRMPDGQRGWLPTEHLEIVDSASL